MKFHGITLEQGSTVTNLVVDSGTSFPSSPDEGELFYRSDSNVTIKGLYLYVNGSWDRIASTDALTCPNGVALPGTATEGDLFYLNTNDSSEGLHVYKNGSWLNISAGAAGTVTSVDVDGGTTGLTTSGGPVTTSGTITLGGTLAVGHGGTGATTAPAARTNLGATTVGGSFFTLTNPSAVTFPRINADNTVTAQAAADFRTDIGAGTVTSVNITAPSAGITASGGPVTSTGSITLALADDLGAVEGLTGTGLAARTATSTWTTRTIEVSGSGLSITNGDAVAGNPSIESNATAANTASTIVFRDGSGNFSAGTITAALSGNASTATALQTGRTFSVSGDASGTSGSFDGTANATIPVTLATVNSNVGTFGSATQVGQFTVNAKGLVTSAADVNIAIAASQVTSGTFDSARISQASVTQHEAALTILESQITDGAVLARVGGNETISGTWSFNNALTVATPTSALHAVTKQYVDELAQGLVTKPAVEVVSTSNLSATYDNGTAGVGATLTATVNGAFPAIDSITISVTTPGLNGVLVAGQSNPAHNGRYNLTTVGNGSTPWVLTRCGLCDEADEIPGAYVFVKRGTIYAGTGWVQIVDDPNTFTVGTDDIDVIQFSTASSYVAGDGLTLSGNIFDVGTASASRIVVNADNIDLATVSDGGGGSFLKFSRDSYGRVTGTSAVVAGDITALVNSTYVAKAGDTMTGTLTLTHSTPSSNPALTSTAGTIRSIDDVNVNGSNFLVNTTTKNVAQYAYDVQRSSATVGGLRIDGSLEAASGTVSLPGVSFVGDNNTGMWRPGADTIAVSTNATERMRIDSSGRVLIGHTTHTQGATNGSLEIQNTSGDMLFITRYSAVAANPAAIYINRSRGASVGTNTALTSGDSIGVVAYRGADGTSWVDGAHVSAVVDGTVSTGNMPSRLLFSTTATTTPLERMRIDSAGRVGIGTTPVTSAANATQLQVGNPTVTTGAGITLGATTTNDIAFADDVTGTGQYAGLIRYSHSTDTMSLWTNSASKVTISSTGVMALSGNVSSSSTTTGTVVVTGGVGVSNNLYVGGSINAVGNINSDGIIRVAASPATNGYLQLHGGGASNTGYVAFHAHTSGTRQGYIGFASTNVAADTGTLPYVAGTHSFTGEIATNSIVRVAIANTAAAPGYTWTTDTDTGMFRVGADTLGFSTNATERMRISSTGAVGITSTDPDSFTNATTGGLVVGHTGNATSALVVGDTATASNNTGLYLRSTSNSYLSVGSGGTLRFTVGGPAGTETMRITSAGNVGIGADTPSRRLHVKGGGIRIESESDTWGVVGSGATATSYMSFYQGNTVTTIGFIGTDGGGILGTGTGTHFGLRANNDLILMSGGSDRFRLLSNGAWSVNSSTGTSGQVLTSNGSGSTPTWQTPTVGTVTSVGVSGSNGIGVSGSPITSNGTITLSLGTITPSNISTDGTVVLGGNTSLTIYASRVGGNSFTATQQRQGTTLQSSSQFQSLWAANSVAPHILLGKSRGASIGTHAATTTNDDLGVITMAGSDGTNFQEGARIRAVATAATTANSITARLEFMTTNAGTTPTTGMTIEANNQVTMPGNIASSSTTTGTLVVTGGVGVSGTINANAINLGATSSISTGSADGYFIGNANAGFHRGILFRTAGTNRWLFRANNAAEGGSNAGSNLEIVTYDDAGSTLRTALVINRASGAWTITGAVSATSWSGDGSGLTALNASNLSSGTVPDARITGSYTGLVNLTGSGTATFNAFSGSGASLTSLNAGNISAGTLAIARGGTNATTVGSAGSVAYSTGSAYAFSAAGTSGQVLRSGGTGAPTWTTATNAATASTIALRDGSGNLAVGGGSTVDDVTIGFRSIPRVGTTGKTLATTDIGRCVASSGGITVPNATFAAGDAITIYNDSASSITITQGASLTLRQAGTTNTGNRTLAARGMATVWFNSSSEAVISGSGLT